jgi:predicted ester cyclase
MSVESNKAAVRRLGEVVSKGDWSAFSDLFAPNYVFHTTPEMKGPEGVKQYFKMLKTAFPDYTEKIENMVGEGDLVAVFYTMSGTFKGEYAGMKPTGKKFSGPACVLAKFQNGKQVEAMPYMDSLSWYQQLSIPIPPA